MSNDDERQSQIDFLIAATARHEARMTRDEQHTRELQESFKLLVELARHNDERFDRHEARTAQNEQHIRELQDSFKLLVELARNTDERLDRSDDRTARLEEAFQTLADIAARKDERIRTLEGKG